MAKIRRVIRKLQPPTAASFDEQLWPVLVALFVLAGLVMGSIAALLPLDGPIWYATSPPWLILTLLSAIAVAVALARINSRTFRRSMQLAILLCLFFHAVLFVATLRLDIFGRLFESPLAEHDLAETRRPVTVPEYFEDSSREDPRRDFERPVETKVPRPQPDVAEIVRQEPPPEPQAPQRQPTPVPEPRDTPQPSLMPKEQLEQTSPRFSEQGSRLSRQVTASAPSPPSTRADAAEVQTQTPSLPAVDARPTVAERRSSPAEPALPAVAEPAAERSQPAAAALARRADSQAPQLQESATPTIQRQIAQPRSVPRTAADLSDTPAVSERTDPNELRPNTTLAQKRQTAAPAIEPSRAEPIPDTPTAETSPPQRQQLRTEPRLDIARTPLPVPNRRTRTTPRPDAATAATRVAAADTPSPPNPELAPSPVAAADAGSQRASREPPVERPTTDAEPTPPRPTVPAAIARRQTPPAPAAELARPAPPAPTTPRRPAPQLAVDARPDPPTNVASTAGEAQPRQPQASATAASRQAVAAVSNASERAAAPEPDVAPAAPVPPIPQRTLDSVPAFAQTAPLNPARSATSEVSPAAGASNPTVDAAAVASAAIAADPTPSPIAPQPQAVARIESADQAEPSRQPSQVAVAEPDAAPRPATSPSVRRSMSEAPVAEPSAAAAEVATARSMPAASAAVPAVAQTPAAAPALARSAVADRSPAVELAARAVSAARQAAGQAAASQADAASAVAAPPVTAAPRPASLARRSPSAESTEIAAAAPAGSSPSRAAGTPGAAPAVGAEPVAAPAVASAALSPAAGPAATRTSAARQSEAAPAAPGAGAVSSLAASMAGPDGSLSAPTATRRPRGPDSPQLAQADASASNRRESLAARPSAATVAADPVGDVAAATAASDQPRPSAAAVARQASADPTATRSQQALESPAASSSAQIAPAAIARADASARPSMTPAADATERPARASLASPLAGSPVNVESPAVAQATRGAGQPSAAPARTAMTKAITGTAGIGSGRNLDRAKPATDSPAMIASASARRAQAIQDTPPGPDLAPSAPALVRRMTAGQAMPGASLPAQPAVRTPTVTGAERPAELAASSSASLRRADANAAPGPVAADRGTTDVDMGATQIVSEGQAGRASGGGQPVMNPETDSQRLARSERVGGVPLAALAATTVVDTPTAPATRGGGQPPAPETQMSATAVARTDPGGAQAVSGGPSLAALSGAPAEASTAVRPSQTALSRAEAAEALPDAAEAGGGEEDEEQERLRLARAASQLAMLAAPSTAEAADAPGASIGDEAPQVAAAGIAVDKAASSGSVTGVAGNLSTSQPEPAAPGPAGAADLQRATGALAASDEPQMTVAGSLAPQRSTGTPGAPQTSANAEAEQIAAASPSQAAGETGSSPLEQLTAVEATRGEASGGPLSAQPAAAVVEVASAGAPEEVIAGIERAAGVQQPQAAQQGTSSGPGRSELAAALPAVALAADAVTPGGAPDSPGQAAGDMPAPGEAAPAALSLARDPSGEGGSSGPSAADAAAVAAAATGSPALPSAAALTRSAADDAAGGAQPQPGATSPATGELALARAAIEAPQLALAGPDPAGVAVAPGSASPAAGGAEASELASRSVQVDSASRIVEAAEFGSAAGEPAFGTEAGLSSGASGGELLAAARFTRAEAVEGEAGAPEIGGGTQSPTRSARGPLLPADSQAQTLQIAGMNASSGLAEGSSIAAQGVSAGRLSGGVRATPAAGPVGAAEDLVELDVASAGASGASLGQRSASPTADAGPAGSPGAPAGLPLARASLGVRAAGPAPVAAVQIAEMGGDEAVGQASLDHGLSPAAERFMVARQATDGQLAVNIDAPVGPGGLGAEPALDAGVNNRRASRESLQVQASTARFVRQEIGGAPALGTAAIVAAEPFLRRPAKPGSGNGGRGSPPPATEEAVELGLAFLARHQTSDGSWSLQAVDAASAALVSDTAATGLALLAFQGAGYNHREHRYADLVNAAIQYLVRNQKPDGDLFVPLDDDSNRSVWIYSHCIAALALCEAYGMTQDPELLEPAQKAVDFIVASQHPDRGGWRYSPRYGSDTSVTGWAMMAIKSGELANLQVPEDAYARIRAWLDKSQMGNDRAHLYRYNPYAPDTDEQRHGREASSTMTSVGLLMRLYLGWKRDNVNMVRGADFLAENPPAIGTPRNPQRDTYYWYYATQVMFHMGGDHWRRWNSVLHPLLIDSQLRSGPLAGSWDPRNPVPDRWAPHAGRLYVTAMNLLSLEVYYRHLPLYEETAR